MAYLGNKPVNNFVSFAKQDITGNGGTSYSLDYPVTGANDIELFINNVRQEPTEAYSCSGATLTLTGAITSSDDVYVIFRGRALQTSVHPSDSALEASQATISGKAEVRERIKVGKANIVQTYESYGYIADFQASSGNQTYISIATPTDSSLGDKGLLVGVDTSAYRITGREAKSMHLATNDLSRVLIDSAGRVTMPYQPAFNAYISSGTNLASSWREVVYNNICYNNGNHYNTSNGRFTAPVSGYYFFAYALTFTAADGDGTIGVFINGSYDGTSSVSQLSEPSSSSPYHGRGASGLIYLSAGDYASVWNYNTDTRTTRSGDPRGGFISGFLVG